MAQVSDATLKSYFEAGDQPTQQQFWDWIDSKVNVADFLSSGNEINIKEAGYNAQGNNVTDDVAAFLQANTDLIALGGGTIYLPLGTYRLADNISFSDLVQLRFDKGAKIAPSVGVVIGNVDLVSAPNAQLFAGSGIVTLRTGSIYNVKWWGATGDGATNDYANVNRTRAAIESVSDAYLLFSKGTYVLGTSITFAATTQVILNNALLSPNTGTTLTLNGSLVAPTSQIFAGLGTIVLGAKIQPVMPQWFGVTGDGATDDYAALLKAQNVVQAQGLGRLLFRAATYVIGTNLTFGTNVIAELQSGAKFSPNTGIVITFTQPPLLPFGQQVFTGAGSVSFLAPPADVIPQWWGAFGKGLDDTAAIQKMFDAMPATGFRILFPRSQSYYGINVEIAVSAKNNIEIYGQDGAKIFLMTNTNWGAVSVHGLHFTDCSNVHVHGLTFDGNGAANASLVTEQHFIMAFDWTYPDLFSATKGISNIEVDDCTFNNYFSSILGVRSCAGVHIHDNTVLQGYQESASAARYPINCTRCDDVSIHDNKLDGGSNSDSTHGTRWAIILVHPGGSTDKWDAAINWCNVVNYQALKQFTGAASASNTSDTVVTFSAVTGAGADQIATGNDFFFMCKDAGDGGAHGGFVNADQMKVIAVDDTAKTFTVRLMDGTEGAGVAASWGGQKVYYSSLKTTRFCSNVEVSNNIMKNSAGLFLLGCKHFSIQDNRGERASDIVLDAEWCMDGSFVGNQIQNPTGNTGIAVLAFARNIIVANNVCSPGAKNVADYLQYGWYEACADIEIANNVFRGGVSILPVSNLENVIDGLTIIGNVIHAAPSSANGAGTIGVTALAVKTNDTGGMIRDCLISGNRIRSAAQRTIGVSGIDGLTIVNNQISNAGYDAIVDENTATRRCTRVFIDGNILNNIGYRSFGSMALWRNVAAPTEPPRFGNNNVWRGVDSTKDTGAILYIENGSQTLPISPMSASVVWDPANVLAAGFTSTTLTIVGAKVGDMVTAGLTTLVGAGMILFAFVSATDTVTVMLYNNDTRAQFGKRHVTGACVAQLNKISQSQSNSPRSIYLTLVLLEP